MYKGDGERQRARTNVLTVTTKQAGQASLLRRRHKLLHPKKKEEIDPFSRENTEVMPII
jgi:hypothetical protein